MLIRLYIPSSFESNRYIPFRPYCLPHRGTCLTDNETYTHQHEDNIHYYILRMLMHQSMSCNACHKQHTDARCSCFRFRKTLFRKRPHTYQMVSNICCLCTLDTYQNSMRNLRSLMMCNSHRSNQLPSMTLPPHVYPMGKMICMLRCSNICRCGIPHMNHCCPSKSHNRCLGHSKQCRDQSLAYEHSISTHTYYQPCLHPLPMVLS